MGKIIGFITVVLCFISFGQEVKFSGLCIDQSNKPLADVIITFNHLITVNSDENGKYSVIVPYADTIILQADFAGQLIKEVFIHSKNTVQVPVLKFDVSAISTVEIIKARQQPFEIPKLPYFDAQRIPMGSVERALVYTTAATSNNELTSSYNVRGGTYDENIVQVNGFVINRPFLTRTGQQEGLGFIYSSLVKDIRFSAGGFDAQYGDKLSSVLDISYRTPTKFRGSVMASLLGVEVHIEDKVNTRFDYLLGVRYRNNGYLLNSLPAKGTYNPSFMDAQFFSNYAINEKLTWTLMAHYSSNNYRFAPQSSQTDFGLANEAYRFNIYFDGKENTVFRTVTTGSALNYKASKKMNLAFYVTLFHTDEREQYDVMGQYYLNQLETDQSKSNFGDSIASLGVGTFLDHARNQLTSYIFSAYHNGDYQLKSGFRDAAQLKSKNYKLKWGVGIQRDAFKDQINEWKMLDSAGYTLPYVPSGSLEMKSFMRGNLNLVNVKSYAFFQWNAIWSNTQKNKIVQLTEKTAVIDSNQQKKNHYQTYIDTIQSSISKIALSIGGRIGYTSVNQEFYATPRATLTYFPRIYMVKNGIISRRDVRFRISSGLYYQPPNYREFRTPTGQLNEEVKSQKSAHFVLGSDVYFNMWGRNVPFKFTAEAYYKYMWDVNPYYVDNVRTIYLANNDATAYAYGVDLNVNGQFIEGIESFFKVGLLSTRENLLHDAYYNYYNSKGELIQPGLTTNNVAVDSAVVHPSFIPRPTDQRFTFGALIQDRMPNYESLSAQVGIQFGTPLPYGPPTGQRYQATLRQKSYFRIDLGLSYDLLYKQKNNYRLLRKYCTDAMISFEIFNILGINNVLSHQWVQTTDGLLYAVPNYLTQRRYNLKIQLKL